MSSKDFQVHSLPALKDNYIHLIVNNKLGRAVVIDPSEAGLVNSFLNKNDLQLDAILLTHHHHDHIGGVLELLKEKPQLIVICSDYDMKRIPGANHVLLDGQTWNWCSQKMSALMTPGHTLGAVSYYWPNLNLLFTGDTVFTWGCGRLFEGTAQMLFESLQKLQRLPAKTTVYCGHEYGLQNLGFTLWLAQNRPTQNLMATQELKVLKAKWADFKQNPAIKSVPSTLQDEITYNLFMKARNSEEFRQFRLLKDDFRLEHYDALG